MMLAHNLDIVFIAGAYRVYSAFMVQIKAMAVEWSSSVIEDSLIRDIDVKDRPQDQGGFSGGDSERDIESEDKAENIRGIMDFS